MSWPRQHMPHRTCWVGDNCVKIAREVGWLTYQIHQARVLRYLTQRFIFEEPSSSCYVQNVMSKTLAVPVAAAWIDFM